MGFETSKRRGLFWEDAEKLDMLIQRFPFHTTGKKERDFETGFATTLMSSESSFNCKIITQIDKSTTVQPVYCFGKKHRPDLALEKEDIPGIPGIAVEVKFVTYAGLKAAIGQGYLYRLKYKFVFLILIISEKRKSIYEGIANGSEKDLEDILTHIAVNMNIFTYIVPAFNINKPGMKKCFGFFR